MAGTEKKYFTMLENNPEVFDALAQKLGLSSDLTFYDVFSLDEADLSYIPRPVYALIVIIPMTPAWRQDREKEDAALGDPIKYYRGGPAASQEGDEPIIWFEQTIGDACGSYAFLHSAINGPAVKFIQPGSTLERLRSVAIPLEKDARARMLYDDKAFEEAHRSVEGMGNTAAPVDRNDYLGGHFIGYVKQNGHLWELEGDRQGPLDRGELDEDEDVLSQNALELGLKRVVNLELESGGQNLRFSCIALAPKA